MSELTSLLNSLEQRLGADDHHLRLAILKWAKSGSVVAPAAVFRALDLFHADLQHAASRAKRLKPQGAGEKRARKLLIEACGDGTRAVHLLRLASSARDPKQQLAGWGSGRTSLGSAAKLYTEARKAAGCGKTC